MRLIKSDKLIFISRIQRDGLGVVEVIKEDIDIKEKFKLHPLSITFGTYVALGFNSYIVKLKK